MKETTSKDHSTKDFINLPESGFTMPKEGIKNYSVKGLFNGVEVELVPITREDKPKTEKRMSTLINISNEIRSIMRSIEDNEGLITEEQELILKELLLSKENKVSAYVSVLDRLENEKTFVKDQIKKANEYIKKLNATQDRMLDIAKTVITASGESLHGDLGNVISLRKSHRVELLIDPNDVPIEYCRIKTEPDLTKIKKAIELGEPIDFAKISENVNTNWK